MATDYRALAVLAAQRYGIDPQIFLRQINQESGFNPNARSSAGAEGIAQFMPSTAAGMHIDPMNPRQALMGAAKMDAGNIRKYGGWAPALSAYNSGNPNAYKDPSFASGQTFNYVKDILGGKNIPMSPGRVSTGGPRVGANLPGGGLPGDGPGLATNPNLAAIAQMMFANSDALAQGQSDPLAMSQSLLALAQARQQLGAAQQVYGPMPQVTPQHPIVQQGEVAIHKGPTQAGGFLPRGASYKPGRQDQGQDFQTDPGAPIVAPGNGIVLDVKSDPNGFGPAYPVVHFTSGPYAGKDVYIGHTIASVRPGQKFTTGTVLSHTGTHPIGNAGVPGWAEIGYAPNGLPGAFGQQVPF